MAVATTSPPAAAAVKAPAGRSVPAAAVVTRRHGDRRGAGPARRAVPLRRRVAGRGLRLLRPHEVRLGRRPASACRTSPAQQYAVTPHVTEDQIQPGDLIFYHSPISHVAIYIGGGALVHAPRTGDVVKVAAVNWGNVVGVAARLTAG